MKILSIDGSKNNVGWATLEINPGKNDKKKAWKWGTWYPEGNSLEKRILDICQTITVEVGKFDILITERPAFYSSEKGQIAAHQNYTIDLAAVNYFIAGWFHMDHRTHYPITAITWKGTVPKFVTARRFFKTFQKTPKHKIPNASEHAIDATMLLHYWLRTYGLNHPLVAKYISAESFRELC